MCDYKVRVEIHVPEAKGIRTITQKKHFCAGFDGQLEVEDGVAHSSTNYWPSGATTQWEVCYLNDVQEL